ncbi:MAG: hypothetical protein CH6_0831 [Candidatus Kapaibacterium sp.]|jgi:two-component system NtrC family sensor kinase|nr:MAG: hypothetical protein CH6_0831 [Candidatus Kapabacteria bacterium]
MKSNSLDIENKTTPNTLGFEIDESKYAILFRRNFIRLFLTYVLPLFLLTLFFLFEYNRIIKESLHLHLKSIAETEAQTLDLFLRERVVNLTNVFEDPNFEFTNDQVSLEKYLEKLRKESEAFVDLGFFDSSGIQTMYAGPFPNLLNIDYSNESWFRKLIEKQERYVITDIYLGFRHFPHFTIALKKYHNGNTFILRSTLEPTKIYEFLLSSTVFRDVLLTLINQEGKYQLSNPRLGSVLEQSPFLPPLKPKVGVLKTEINGKNYPYGYCWLAQTQWCVIVLSENPEAFLSTSFERYSLLLSAAFMFFLAIVIFFRAKKIVQYEKEKEIAEMEKNIARSQLEHASKLATIGELAAGIAHEINNPLAIIASEAGLIKDLLNPEFKQNVTPEEIIAHLDIIQNSAFRARDITRKLMTFVRKDNLKLDYYDVNQIIEELLEGFIEHELYVSNIKVEKNLQPNLQKVYVDANSLKQVIMNLLSNARDAITPPGKITISTRQEGKNILISVKDTGCGISKEQMEKIFMPFFTTKPVGKGTGLGLSVSYNIVKSFGGTIEVESLVGKGSTFTIVLPIKNQ